MMIMIIYLIQNTNSNNCIVSIPGCPSITCLSLTPGANVRVMSTSSQRLIDLHYLDMSSCSNLEDSGLQIIVSYCINLVQLYLRRCIRITDVGVQYVASYCHRLQELSISDCRNISDFGVSEISRLQSRLRYLSIARCENVGNVGLIKSLG